MWGGGGGGDGRRERRAQLDLGHSVTVVPIANRPRAPFLTLFGWLTPACLLLPLLPKNGHQGGSGHPPPPRPIRLSRLLRAEVHDYHGPTREEPCVSIIPNTALSCKTAFNPNSLKDDDLAGRLGLQLKELTKLVTVLDKAGLVKTYVRLFKNCWMH